MWPNSPWLVSWISQCSPNCLFFDPPQICDGGYVSIIDLLVTNWQEFKKPKILIVIQGCKDWIQTRVEYEYWELVSWTGRRSVFPGSRDIQLLTSLIPPPKESIKSPNYFPTRSFSQQSLIQYGCIIKWLDVYDNSFVIIKCSIHKVKNCKLVSYLSS